jgi:hypothetical protein
MIDSTEIVQLSGMGDNTVVKGRSCGRRGAVCPPHGARTTWGHKGDSLASSNCFGGIDPSQSYAKEIKEEVAGVLDDGGGNRIEVEPSAVFCQVSSQGNLRCIRKFHDKSKDSNGKNWLCYC